MANWLDLSATSNLFKSIYIKGFVDISGGDFIARNGNLVIAGNSQLAQNVTIGGNLQLSKRIQIIGDASFHGNTLAITPASTDNSSKVATTAYVQNAAQSYASLNGAAFTGDVSMNKGLYVNGNIISSNRIGASVLVGTTILENGSTLASTYATLASPILTGLPSAPTPAVGTNTDQIATTAYVVSEVGSLIGSTSAIVSSLQELSNIVKSDASYGANIIAQIGLKAPINNPTFTGTVRGIDASMVGLGVVDNTSDANKPISTATQSALDLKAPLASPAFTGTVTGITATMIGLGNVSNLTDANRPISNATQSVLNTKAPLANPVFTGTVSGISAAMVGLGSVTNTSDANKPISTATASALATKAPLSNPTFTGTVSGISAAMVNLGQVNNTADIDKPVSTATQTQLDLKAPLDNPVFTGTVSGISASMVGLGLVNNVADEDKPISTATQAALNQLAPLASPVFTNGISVYSGDASFGNNVVIHGSLSAASVYENGATLTSKYATVASPALTGIPTAPTPAAGNVSNQIATTQYVVNEVGSIINSAPSIINTLQQLSSLVQNDASFASNITSQISLCATINNPTFTGVVRGIDASMVGLGLVDNTADVDKPISLAVQEALSNYALLSNPTFTGTVGGITAAMVGLSNVNNTSDVNKPVSTATQTALAAKAPLANPTFTGTVTGITASMVGLGSVNNTSDANKPVSTATASALAAKAPITNPTFTGTVSGITASMVGLGSVNNTSDISKPLSLAAQTALNLKAPLTNPSFTGDVTLSTGNLYANNGLSVIGDASFNHNIIVNNAIYGKTVYENGNTLASTYATIKNTSLTGIPTAPTAAGGTNSTQIATTAYVTNELSSIISNVPNIASTLQQLSSIISSDASFASSFVTQLAAKAPINNPSFTGTVYGVSKAMVGLSNVDNTSDANKPLSTATSAAIASLAPIDNPTFTGTVSGITADMVGLSDVDNTSDADKPLSTAASAALAALAPINNPTFTGVVGGITAAMVGLSNVDNTSDANKPISSATQTALDSKASSNNPTFTGTVTGISKASIGLGSVNNTSDANKPISSATQTALDAKAPSTNPVFTQGFSLATGDASFNDNITVGNKLTVINGLAVTGGSISLPTGSLSSNMMYGGIVNTTTTQTSIVGDKSFLGNLFVYGTGLPTFTDISQVLVGNYASNLVATTGYVRDVMSSLIGTAPQALNTIYELAASLNGDASAVTGLTTLINTKAPSNNAVFTGSTTVPNASITTLLVSGDASLNGNLIVYGNLRAATQSAADNSNRVATTSYVKTQVSTLTTTLAGGYATIIAPSFTGGVTITGDLSINGNILASYPDSSIPAAAVQDIATLSTSQVITGSKTFTGDVSMTGNVSVNNVSITGNMLPTVGNTYNLGSEALPFNSLYVNKGTIYFTDSSLGVTKTTATLSFNTTTGQIEVAAKPVDPTAPVIIANPILNVAGNVGIGTNTPQFTLDVSGTSNLLGNAIINNKVYIGSDVSVNCQLLTSGNIVTQANLLAAGSIFEGGASLISKYATLASPTFSGTVGGISKAMVGLGLVDNVSDADKPISTAAQSALDLKAPSANPSFSGTVALDGTTITGLYCASITDLSSTYAHLDSPTFSGVVSGISKTMVGLGNVDNVSDLNKPISTAAQTALDLKAPLASPSLTGTPTAPTASTSTNTSQIATTAFVQTAINDLVGGAPTLLNTLNELAIAINNDASFATDITTMIGLKAPSANPSFSGTVALDGTTITGLYSASIVDLSSTYAHLASPTFTGVVSGISKAMIGLGNVDNVSDANKPISTAAQSALDLKAPSASPIFSGTVALDGTTVTGLYSASIVDLSSTYAHLASPTFTGVVSGISKAMVGLGNVDNVSDANKPISTVTQNALDLKAPLLNPAFTGTVTGISATMVNLGNVDNVADVNKPISTATQNALDLKAPLASPTLTGTPTAPTASSSTNTAQLATTAFVQTAINDLVGGAPTLLNTLNELAIAINNDASFATDITTMIGLKAPSASPTFTGTVALDGTTITGLYSASIVDLSSTYAHLANPRFTGSLSSAGPVIANSGIIVDGGDVSCNHNVSIAGTMAVQNGLVFGSAPTTKYYTWSGSPSASTIAAPAVTLTFGNGSFYAKIHCFLSDGTSANNMSTQILELQGGTTDNSTPTLNIFPISRTSTANSYYWNSPTFGKNTAILGSESLSGVSANYSIRVELIQTNNNNSNAFLQTITMVNDNVGGTITTTYNY